MYFSFYFQKFIHSFAEKILIFWKENFINFITQITMKTIRKKPSLKFAEQKNWILWREKTARLCYTIYQCVGKLLLKALYSSYPFTQINSLLTCTHTNPHRHLWRKKVKERKIEREKNRLQIRNVHIKLFRFMYVTCIFRHTCEKRLVYSNHITKPKIGKWTTTMEAPSETDVGESMRDIDVYVWKDWDF